MTTEATSSMNIDELLPVPRTCCSDLELDELLAGALSPESATKVRAHLAASPSCASHFASLEAAFRADQATLRPLPPAPAARPRLVFSTSAALAAASLAIFFVVRDGATPPEQLKGRASVDVKVKRASGGDVVTLGDGSQVAAGDRLRFVAHAAHPSSVAVISIDGANQTNVYVPPRMVPAGRTELAETIELDDVRGREALHLFQCDSLVDVQSLVRAAEGGALPGGCEAHVVTLEKP
jgi:hypothetical protein